MTKAERDRVFGARSDQTCCEITSRPRGGEATVTKLPEPSDITVRFFSCHIAELEAAGFVARGLDAQRRPSRLAPRFLESIDDRLGNYRSLWSARFDQLSRRLEVMRIEDAGEFRIRRERYCDAPREAVFAKWRDANALRDWFVPAAYDGIVVAVDPTPGGI